jgi:hypothetical protein
VQVAQTIQLRNGTAAQWTSSNPTLARGEAGVEWDTGKIKLGNGSTAWASLAYLAGSGGGGSATYADRGNWATATSYTVGDVATQAGTRYICAAAHTSGTFSTDLTASRWVALDPGAAVPLAQAASGQDPVALGVAAVGSQAVAARADHVHPATSSPLPPMRVSTGWKTIRPLDASSNFAAPAQSTLLCTPMMVTAAETWDRVGLRCSAVVAGSTVRLGVYNDNGNGQPGTLLAEWGTIDTATATGDLTLTISQALNPGLYWLAGVSQGGAPSVRCVNATPNDLHYFIGSTPFNFGQAFAFQQASVTGALPATFTSGGITGSAPHRLFVRTQ